MRSLSILLVLVFSVRCIHGAGVGQQCNTWTKLLGFLKRVLDDCKHIAMESKDHPGKELYLQVMQHCLKKKTLISLDRMLELDVIPLNRGMELIRYSNNTARVAYGTGRATEEEAWHFQVLDRLGDLFRTHALRFTLEDETGDSAAVIEKQTATGRVRHRHFYRHIFPMMVVAFMMMITILVPLGFQFMAVIGGKALLLSKMALMLSSAQAMKRVTSAWFDVYHAPTAPISYGHIHRSYHQQHDQDHDHDRHRHQQQQWDLGHHRHQHQQFHTADLGQQLLYASPSSDQQLYQTLPAGYTYPAETQNQLLGWT